MKKKIIVVIGMHRSGTSALTRALRVLNVDLGDNLMKPIINVNDKGFFEDLDINRFNDYLLNKMGCIWCSCKIPQINQLEILNDAKDIEVAIELLNSKIRSTNLFGFKDPRVSVLLPFWQKIFELCNIESYYLISIRNPLSVAKSLHKRDKFTIKKGLFLWAEYMLAGIQNTNNKNRVFIQYEELIKYPIDQISKIATKFNLEINDVELHIYANEFLDFNLQHINFDLDDLKQNIIFNESTYQLYRLILNNLNFQNSNNLDLFEIREIFNFDIKDYLDEFEFQDFLMKKISKNEISANLILSKSHELITNNAILSNELILARDIISKYTKKLLNEAENFNKTIETKDNLLNKQEEEIHYKNEYIKLVETNIRNIYNSRSWKITKPLRLIKILINK